MPATQAVVAVTLNPRPPFDFAKSLRFINGFGPMEAEQTAATDTLIKAFQIGGQTVAVRLENVGTVDKPELAGELLSEAAIDKTVQNAVLDRVRFWLSLDDDLAPFYTLTESDEVFTPVVQALYGYHQVKFGTPFEAACWAILSARNRLPIARGQKAKLVAQYGGQIALDGQTYPAFPEPQAFLASSPGEISGIMNAGFGQKRGEYLFAAAETFAELDEGWLRTAPTDEVEARLRAINGIGAWSVMLILIRGLGRVDRLMTPEQVLIDLVSRMYGVSPTAEVARKLAERYHPYAGLWGHYLRAVGSVERTFKPMMD